MGGAGSRIVDVAAASVRNQKSAGPGRIQAAVDATLLFRHYYNKALNAVDKDGQRSMGPLDQVSKHFTGRQLKDSIQEPLQWSPELRRKSKGVASARPVQTTRSDGPRGNRAGATGSDDPRGNRAGATGSDDPRGGARADAATTTPRARVDFKLRRIYLLTVVATTAFKIAIVRFQFAGKPFLITQGPTPSVSRR